MKFVVILLYIEGFSSATIYLLSIFKFFIFYFPLVKNAAHEVGPDNQQSNIDIFGDTYLYLSTLSSLLSKL